MATMATPCTVAGTGVLKTAVRSISMPHRKNNIARNSAAYKAAFPNLTALPRDRPRCAGGAAVVLRVSGAKGGWKTDCTETVRLQTSIPLIKPQFNQIGLGLDIHHQPKRSYRIGASFPAFADWSQDKSDPLLLAYDSKSLSERAALIVGSSSQPPCRQTASGCNYGELRLNLFETTGTLTLLPATLLPTLNTSDMVDQSYLLYPAQGIGAAEHETLSWMRRRKIAVRVWCRRIRSVAPSWV